MHDPLEKYSVVWDSPKLHAPLQTVVEGRVRGGKIVELHVTPESRRGDVVVWHTEEGDA